MALDSSVLPSELVTVAQPLVGLSGLDVQRNNTHKTIWDAFINNKKPDGESIQYKLLPQNYEFPVSKPKHQSYEWYHPKGILKRNWMLKHLHVLPAVVVLFQDLEWNDPQWSEKQLQCASMIQSLKNSLQGRNTRLAVVLLQKGISHSQGEDLLASERAAHLTSTCDINAKMLFVLPHGDHLVGHIMRLQSAFLELAQSYYAQMMKQIRLHREQLTDSHQILKIRHQFKLGFISELKLDQSNALRHYRQTYANLEEIRVVDTNCLEIKSIAGFVNYKICRLFFKLNTPKDSITHFKNHINKYRSLAGFKELLFEHYAWLSVQYSSFGELFCEAVKNGLSPLQTQHPGIYFHKAAEYISKRKEAFLQCTALGPDSEGQSAASAGQPNSNSVLYSDFFGIRGTKTGEPVSEQQIICLVQEMEKSYNHSAAIITLLGQAMAQYKVYKCLRFRKKLAIDMAEEYLKCGDHSKALTLYSLMLSDYRADKWFTIFTEVLLKTLRSAYLSASVPDFVACSIETLSPRIAMEKSDRILILENLWKVFHNISPVSSSQIAPELSSNWQTALSSFSSPVKLDLDRLSDLLECKITFDKRQIRNDENLHLQLYIRSISDVPLKLKNFSVLLSDLKSNSVRVPAVQYSEYLEPGTEEEACLKPIGEFILEPQKCYRILFVGERYQFMENVDVHIFRLEMEMGSDRTFVVLSQREKLNVQRMFKNFNPHQDCLERIAVISSCYIIPTFHLGSQTKQSNQPMLTNEFYKITTKIINNSDLCLKNVGISISVPQPLRNNVFLTTDLSPALQRINSYVQIDIGELQMQSATSISYYATSLIEGNIELRQRLYYQTENLHQVKTSGGAMIDSPSTPNSEKEGLAKLIANNERGTQKYGNSHNIKFEYITEELVRKIKEDTIVVPCVEELKLTGRFYTLSRQPLVKAYKNEDFILRIAMEVKAPDGLDILETQFISDHNIVEKPYKGQPSIVGSKLRQSSRFEDLRLLNPTNCTRDWITQGDYLNNDVQLKFNRSRTPDHSASGAATTSRLPPDDQFNRSLLAKLPTNATIIGMMTSSTGSAEDFKIKSLPSSDQPKDDFSKSLAQVKNIYNQAIDCVQLTNNERNGFINATISTSSTNGAMVTRGRSSEPGNSGTADTSGDNGDRNLIFGVYCVRWSRSSSPNVINESKFVISGIEVVDPPLNIYCYLETKMYVRVPVTLRITLKNPTRKILHLQAVLNSSDSFMFSGHKQLKISIFAHSAYDLLFNLYPLKAGWQPLPELQLDYANPTNGPSSNKQPGKSTTVVSNKMSTSSESISSHPGEAGEPSSENLETQLKAELNCLVKRWMPKMVFIHPPRRY
ncbi:trafficking protein particle complex subunit 11 isoform X2 [Toxorhynchites rutilus septentrionalis]|uniref:trafficking protein particle complex subunit 11 isoform X2 n=1 Tax=Toxorhynchites rutilus septentrionalis TaxID=329112 RepID=UPI00247A14BB|nr:trafficking protein particle complex subunit 11 isoform X2 [Toxorhynchites rutilus septentrionalis]